jgi:hypothetical protein
MHEENDNEPDYSQQWSPKDQRIHSGTPGKSGLESIKMCLSVLIEVKTIKIEKFQSLAKYIG